MEETWFFCRLLRVVNQKLPSPAPTFITTSSTASIAQRRCTRTQCPKQARRMHLERFQPVLMQSGHHLMSRPVTKPTLYFGFEIKILLTNQFVEWTFLLCTIGKANETKQATPAPREHLSTRAKIKQHKVAFVVDFRTAAVDYKRAITDSALHQLFLNEGRR